MASGASSAGGSNHPAGGGLGGAFWPSPSATAHSPPTVVGTASLRNPNRCSTASDTSIASRLSMPSWRNVVSAVFSSAASGRFSFSSIICATAAFVSVFTFERSNSCAAATGGG